MQRKIIGIAVLVTIAVLVYLFFPSNFMDYYSNSISPTKESTSAFVQRTTQPAVTQPTPAAPVPQPAQLPANPPPPSPQKGGHAVSEYLRIRHMAEENHVRLLRFDETNIGDATMQVESGDKNNIFDFMDAIERGINLRDMENKSKGYRIMYDRDGRQIVQAVLWIRYIPRFETNP